MERGAREKSLLQDHCGSADKFGETLKTLGIADLWSASVDKPFFAWRSGDDVADGGHMAFPSIGQAMSSSTNSVASSATKRSGNAHIAPITWQKANTSTNTMYRVFARKIMRPTTLLARWITEFCSASLSSCTILMPAKAPYVQSQIPVRGNSVNAVSCFAVRRRWRNLDHKS